MQVGDRTRRFCLSSNLLLALYVPRSEIHNQGNKYYSLSRQWLRQILSWYFYNLSENLQIVFGKCIHTHVHTRTRAHTLCFFLLGALFALLIWNSDLFVLLELLESLNYRPHLGPHFSILICSLSRNVTNCPEFTKDEGVVFNSCLESPFPKETWDVLRRKEFKEAIKYPRGYVFLS